MTVGREEKRSVAVALSLFLPLCALMGGCIHLDPGRLNVDQIDYSRALADAEKTLTLLNIVRLRYGDMPTFLNTSQVISGYQLQQNVNPSFEWFPYAPISTYLSASGLVDLQQKPTFTFQPVGGDAFAQTFLRPLPPDQLLPLVMGAVPIDLLFRLTVQSIASLQNSSGFGPGEREESAEFDLLLQDLRRLQLAGLTTIRVEEAYGPDGKPLPHPKRVYFSLKPARDPDLAAVEADTRRLLGLRPGAGEVEVVYGQTASAPTQIALLTRSMLGVLGQLAGASRGAC